MAHGVRIYTDAGSRGNPGDSAIGIIIVQNGIILIEHGEYVGVCTNNQAEYKAVIKGLELCAAITNDSVQVYSDSQLVVYQILQIYRIKEWKLHALYLEVKNKENAFRKVKYYHVPRENEYIKRADKLVNKCLDDMNNR